MIVGQIENYLLQESNEQVQNSLKIIYGAHLKGGISKGDSVLTLEEAAEILRLSRDTARNILRDGRIKGVGTGGYRRKWQINRSELDEFLRGES